MNKDKLSVLLSIDFLMELLQTQKTYSKDREISFLDPEIPVAQQFG